MFYINLYIVYIFVLYLQNNHQDRLSNIVHLIEIDLRCMISNRMHFYMMHMEKYIRCNFELLYLDMYWKDRPINMKK